MANLIKVKRTNTALAVPSLVYGELGFNSADGKLYVGNFSDVATQVGGGGGGSGTVTSVSVVTANGVSGSVATSTTTPAITVTLGAITPSSVTVSGVITASAGTVALPSITTSSDTNTGIYFPAADSVSTSVGGVEKLRVDSNGIGLAVREDGGIAPSTYYLTTQAQAGLTILHAAKGGSELSGYQPKRHLMAYAAYVTSANGIMRIKIPVNASNALRVTIKHTPLTSSAFSRAWEITLSDYYVAGYSFTPDSFAVEGSPNFRRVRLMTDGIYRYLVLGSITTGAGTVTTVSGNTTVTGTSSKFQTLFRVGDAILINGSWSYVSAITSDTVLTVAANNSGTNTAVVYSRGDSFSGPQVTVDVDVLGPTVTPIQINTAFSVDIAETESGLSLVSAANDFSLTNTSSQHSFVGIGTQRPTSLLHVAQEKTGVGTVSNGAAGTTVTGVNTKFLDTFKVGDSITIPSAGLTSTNQTVVISAIASNTSMTTAAITSANSAVSYSLAGGTLFSVAGNGTITTSSSGNTLSGTNTGDQTAASLGLVIGTNVQAYDAKLTTLAGLAVTDNAVIIGNGTSFVVESGATLKTSLGLTIGTNVQAYSYRLTDFAALVHSYQGFLVSDGTDWAVNTPTQVRTALSLTVGTDVQAYKAGLQSLGNISTTGADRVIYATATNVYTTSAFTAFGRSLVDDADAATARTTLEIGKIASTLAGGRLTLETGVGVSSSDQTAKTTIYYTPFAHGMIGLYDGTNWIPREFTQKSLALGTLVSGKNYDVFAVSIADVISIEALAWTSDSARATALVAVDGVLCKTGSTDRRYVGTFRTTTTTTTEDSEAKRFVYNVANKVPRSMLGTLGYVDDNAGTTFTFNSQNVWAALNSGTGNKCEFVNGLTETVLLAGSVFYTAGAGSYLMTGIGTDTTTSASFIVSQNDAAGGSAFQRANNKSVSFAAGYHYGSLNGVVVSANVSATIYRDDSRYGGTVDPIRTFISASITS
jgi:hypothetical protein